MYKYIIKKQKLSQTYRLFLIVRGREGGEIYSCIYSCISRTALHSCKSQALVSCHSCLTRRRNCTTLSQDAFQYDHPLFFPSALSRGNLRLLGGSAIAVRTCTRAWLKVWIGLTIRFRWWGYLLFYFSWWSFHKFPLGFGWYTRWRLPTSGTDIIFFSWGVAFL